MKTASFPLRLVKFEKYVPESYRGVPVPPRLRQYWDKPTGRAWRSGVDAKAAVMPIEVYPGQVYADGDYRVSGRTVKVMRLAGEFAVCEVLTNYEHVQALLDEGLTDEEMRSEYGQAVRDMRGTHTCIMLRRFYPNARGYRLLPDESCPECPELSWTGVAA